MPATPTNSHYAIPQKLALQRGDLGVAHAERVEMIDVDPRYAQQVDARLQLRKVYDANMQSRASAIAATDGFQHASTTPDHPTFPQVESFLYEVADWMAFNRKEVGNNG